MQSACASTVSFLYLLHLVLRRSSSVAGAVDLPFVWCRAGALPELTLHLYLLYSSIAPAHRQPASQLLPRRRRYASLGMSHHVSCLAMFPVFVHTILHVLMQTCHLCIFHHIIWSVICCQGDCSKVTQKRGATRVSRSQF